MADLEELEPYVERGVIQRMGRDVRALFLDRELAEDFVSMDVTILRFRSPGSWSELQQHLPEHLRDVFKDDGLRDAFLGQSASRRRLRKGRGRRAVRQAVAEGGETIEMSLDAWWTCWRLCLWSTRQN